MLFTLETFHKNGLSASKLQQLELSDTSIEAADVAEATAFSGTQCLVPRNLSALTALTSLFISYSCESKRLELEWLSQLPSLQSVSLEFHVQRMTLPESISRLSQMTYLLLSNTA